MRTATHHERKGPDVKRSLQDDGRFAARRRGVTLVEMMVTLAVLLIMMTVVVKIFQAATGSLSSAQVCQELDNGLRLLDATIRSDLNGVTATLTPPNDPRNNKGYLEYGENEFADLQGEDSDDYIRFTAKAPAGRPFTGRMWVPPPIPISTMSAAQLQNYVATQPITITSEYAEIIYFLRNGNLYRRVLLVAPEREAAIAGSSSLNPLPPPGNIPANNPWIYKDPSSGAVSSFNFAPNALASIPVSWQSMNDLSAHPAPRGTPTTNSVVLNALGDLTNRENRGFYQRFGDDFLNLAGGTPTDGLTDDFNGDNVPDYYPTLYPTVLTPINAAGQLLFEPLPAAGRPAIGTMAFPFVYPGAYSRPQVLSNFNVGWIHSPEPIVVDAAGSPHQYDLAPLLYLQNLNHNPIEVGDNLPDPSSGGGGAQTWWGFPTWRETLSPFWTDPTWQVNTNSTQPLGLGYILANTAVPTGTPLPGMTSTYRGNPQPFSDGFGDPSAFFPLVAGSPPQLWNASWEDDLIMTGVRSFDIKAYDNSLASYADLGWGDDPRLTATLVGGSGLGSGPALPYLAGNWDSFGRIFYKVDKSTQPPTITPIPIGRGYNAPAHAVVNGKIRDLLNETFAHEGRIPPLQNDNRLDASYANKEEDYANLTNFNPQIEDFPAYSSNVGDDNPAVFRLRRVWDSWSTAYSRAPGTGVYATGFPAGPPFSPPIYPSYPPPYPAPLRGIQIQIRVTDPTNQRIKTLTIRQDFTDKL